MELPLECICEIADYLDTATYLSLRLTCHTLINLLPQRKLDIKDVSENERLFPLIYDTFIYDKSQNHYSFVIKMIKYQYSNIAEYVLERIRFSKDEMADIYRDAYRYCSVEVLKVIYSRRLYREYMYLDEIFKLPPTPNFGEFFRKCVLGNISKEKYDKVVNKRKAIIYDILKDNGFKFKYEIPRDLRISYRKYKLTGK